MNQIIRHISLGALLAPSLLIFGCATAGPPPAPTSVTMSCNLPTLAPLPETKERQSKGGIGITLAVPPFLCEEATHDEVRQKQSYIPGLPIPILNSSKKGPVYETTKTPYLHVLPDRVKFSLRVSNQLSRVFHGNGTVIQFTVAGKTWAAKQEDYGEFTNVIIPPRGEQEIDIYGPPVDKLPKQATIGIFLFDVVTKVDAAGNVVEKQNFEWYYNYGVQVKEQVGTVRVETT